MWTIKESIPARSQGLARRFLPCACPQTPRSTHCLSQQRPYLEEEVMKLFSMQRTT